MRTFGGIAFAAVLAGGAILAGRSLAAGESTAITDPAITGPSHREPGEWRTKVQHVFDAATRTLSRRVYQLWDPEPSRNLDFVWTPDDPAADKPGRINGTGHLVWRMNGKPAYDRSSVFAEYRGGVRNGRLEGHGAYLDHTGLLYEGDWRNGMIEGRGRITLPSGDEYVGEFRAGKAHGTGRYIDTIGEVYEGPFVNGYRHGRGQTTLPNRSQYASVWSMGKEAEASRLVRLAQSGGGLPAGAAGDIRIGITIDKRLPPAPKDNPRPQKGDLWYSVKNAPDGVVIEPDDAKLMSIWKGGGEIQVAEEWEEGFYTVLSRTKGQIVPLTLMLEVQNRSSGAISINGAYLDVRSSITDLQPAIQLRTRMHECFNPYYRPMFNLENFGWGPAEQAQIQFNFASRGGGNRPVSFQISKTSGRIDKSVTVNLEDDLKAAKVNTTFLARNKEEGITCKKPKTIQACLQELKASGTFGSIADKVAMDGNFFVTRVVGKLEYVWRDAQGQVRNATSQFNAAIPLGVLFQAVECGEGGARQEITATSQQLRLDASNYRIPVSFGANIASGNTSRLTLPLKADKSSEHDFVVVLQLSDGREVKSRRIKLLYYLPSWVFDDAN